MSELSVPFRTGFFFRPVVVNVVILAVVLSMLLVFGGQYNDRSNVYLNSGEIAELTPKKEISFIESQLTSRFEYYDQLLTKFYWSIFLNVTILGIAILVLTNQKKSIQIKSPFERKLSSSLASIVTSIVCLWIFIVSGFFIDKLVDERFACWQLAETQLILRSDEYRELIKSLEASEDKSKTQEDRLTAFRKTIGSHPRLRDVGLIDAWMKWNYGEFTDQRISPLDWLRLSVFSLILGVPVGICLSLLSKSVEDGLNATKGWVFLILMLGVYDACHVVFWLDGNGSIWQLISTFFSASFLCIDWRVFGQHTDV